MSKKMLARDLVAEGAWDGELLSLDPLGSVSPHAPSSLCHGAQPTNETRRATAALRKVQHSNSLANVAFECCVRT